MSKGSERPDLNLDKSSEQGFCKFFNSLPLKDANTLRVFERSNGDFYSVHGEDAEYVANTVYKTTTVIKHLGGGKGLPSCTMSRMVAEAFLRDALLVHQRRLEIYAPSDGRSGAWEVARTASPGNLQGVEEMLFSNTEMTATPVVMGIKFAATVDTIDAGVAFVDAAQREISVCEFVDTDVFSTLESLVIQLGVKECVIEREYAHSSAEHRRLFAVLERCSVVVTERARAEFSTADLEQDLARILDMGAVPVASMAECALTKAMGALAATMRYLDLLADEGSYASYTMRTHSVAQFMRLDASAVHALNLLPSAQDGASKSMSLLGLLDKCKTPQGHRLLAQWLKQPLLSAREINDRLDLVAHFFADAELRERVRGEYLRSMPDFKRLAKRLVRGSATLQDVVRIYQVALSLPGLCSALSAPEAAAAPRLLEDAARALRAISSNLGSFQSMVETTVDLELVALNEYALRADFDAGLQETRANMDSAMRQVLDEQSRAADALALEVGKKLKLEDHATFGHCLRVSRGDGSRLRGARFVELATLKTGVLFTTTRMRESSRLYRDLRDEYARAQAALVREVVKVAASYSPVLESLNGVVARLDVALSFAEASANAPVPYVRPAVSESSREFVLRASRHPCLEMQDDVSFIPNDVRMERAQSDFVVITGPNMGGKSTFIRQIGVVALMAQVGCFVPCDEASVCTFDCILARVGAGDAQLKGVSTFMAEMLETAAILKTATAKSLVVIDELGRGTSTYDGFGLAWAISEHIIRHIKCMALFATHFHELTEIGRAYPNVDNRHVAARVASGGLTLLYKIEPGVCDQSFGIHVAQLAKFPDSVVRLAKRKAAELEDSGPADAEGGGRASKADVAGGSRLIERFLAEFASTPGLKSMGRERVAARVVELRAKYDEEISSNPWLKDVIEAL